MILQSQQKSRAGSSEQRDSELEIPKDLQMNDGRYVTLKDLARACGVTPTTVSLALRNHPRISAETKDKVRRMAAEMNYHRHPMISALMVKLKQAEGFGDAVPLAVLYTHSASSILANSYHQKIWQGMERRAKELGFKLDRFYLDQKVTTGKKISDILNARGIAGVIIPPLRRPGGHLRLQWENFCSVAIGYSLFSPDLHRICPNQYRGIRLALREIRKLGYQRPGLLLNNKSDLRTLHQWSSGYYGFQNSENRRRLMPVLHCDSVSEKEFVPWLKKYKPDIVISSDLQILEVLSKTGLKAPQDFGLVTLSRWEQDGGIAGLDQNEEALGAATIEQLVQMLNYNEVGIPDLPRVILIPPAWRNGPSIVRQVQNKP